MYQGMYFLLGKILFSSKPRKASCKIQFYIFSLKIDCKIKNWIEKNKKWIEKMIFEFIESDNLMSIKLLWAVENDQLKLS